MPTPAEQTTAGQEQVERLAVELPAAVGPLFRLIRRAVAVDYTHPRLPDAHVDLLRLVERRPGVSVGEGATELRLAANTVSALVRELVDQQMVERRKGRSDRRTSELHLTPLARDRLRAWGEHRHRVMLEVLGTLAPGDRQALTAALPALEGLKDALQQRAHRAAARAGSSEEGG